MSSEEPDDVGRRVRVDTGEILVGALERLGSTPESLSVELLAVLDKDDANRVQRIQSAIESATDG